MAEQFSASAAFKNLNNNTDGWGEDWGDWNETPTAAPSSASNPMMGKPLQPGNSVAPTSTVPNQYFQQQQQQQPSTYYNQQQPHGGYPPSSESGQQLRDDVANVDHRNQNYMPSYNATQGYGAPAYHYPPAPLPQPSVQAPPLAETQGYGNAPLPAAGYSSANSFFNAPPMQQQPPPPQRPPSHPPASTTPQLVPTFSQTISDSFDTSAGNSWNWSVSDSAKTRTPSTGPTPPHEENHFAASERTVVEHAPPRASSQQASTASSLDGNSSQQQQRFAMPDGFEHRSSSSSGEATVNPARSAYQPQPLPPLQTASSVAQATAQAAVPDRLDEVLEALSLKQEPNDSSAANQEPSYREQAFPPPPPSIAGNHSTSGGNGGPLMNEALNHATKSASTTPPLPPPPMDNNAPAGPPPVTAAPPPMVAPVAGPPKMGPPAGSAANPFKRAGPRSHIATPGLGASAPIAPSGYAPSAANSLHSNQPQQQQQQQQQQQPLPPVPRPAPIVPPEPAHFESSAVPENREILSEPDVPEVVQPSNDRNQYLQTGHLSEDGYGGGGGEEPQDTADARMPPPGLSRYVPGQNQQQRTMGQAASGGQSFPEPPPGLDRMIPGTDLTTNELNDLSLERQADGEVSDQSASAPASAGIRSDLPHHSHHGHHHTRSERVDMTDRNLYRVPGESDHQQQQQQQQVRVVPGLEDDRSTAVGASTTANVSQPPGGHSSAREEQRELIMDGENPDDRRDEPIDGGNGDTNGPAGSVGAAMVPAATAEPPEPSVEPPVRPTEPSNTSTGEDSEKERSGFYGKGGLRREDDAVRRSNKSKSSRDRYDTEDSDYSESERRRRDREPNAGSQAAATSHGQRGERSARHRGDREKDARKDAGHRSEARERDRDRDRDRDRERDRERDRDRDYEYRDRERNRYDRGDRERDRGYGRSSKYDRDSRYETDGSKYETERSTTTGARYEKDESSKRYRDRDARDEYYRKRGGAEDRGAEDGRREREGDRRLRKEKGDRSERYRGEDRRKDDRYREGGEKRRDHRPHHDRRYDLEEYRAGSRNGTERDRARDSRERDDRKEKDRKYLAAGGYGAMPGAIGAAGTSGSTVGPYGPASGYYDPYSYYAQHQQYYEQLRRTNPAAYAEWYRTYYAQMQASQMQRNLLTSDGRESVHSGRSSTNDKERLDQLDASAIKVEASTELSVMEPERLTPRKFPEIHPIVSLSAGLLISTKNRLTMNGMADTVKIFSLGYSDASKKLFHTYPGPLVKGVTHKKSVIEFCEDQLRQGPPYSGALALIKSRGNSINSLHSSSLAAGANRGSFTLLWNYIILLLRQNGTFVGTDISELLMTNKEEYPFESSAHGASAIRSGNISGRNSSLSVAAIEREADIREDAESEDEPAPAEAIEPVSEGPKQLSELEITDKFRSYLIYGNISEALEWATEHNLWGHALFLASKVDSRQHANVMMKFANKLTLNDPLQTLYQLLSGRTPASVTSVLDEKWGDWRPHLAMLMSNSSAKPELIKKSITTLGDTLFNRGDLYAAHFCYLLSDVAFGRLADVKPEFGAGGATTVRLVLLGASHHQRNFRELSTNESIMMTEIYEYARSLNEDRYSITELQRFKYLLACRMLDQGMQLKCLLYMEQIAEQIQNDPYRFETDFVRKVYTLGDRLKYYDPVMEKALDESVDNTGRGNIYAKVEDPEWLRRLQEIINSNNQQSAEHVANYNSNLQEAAYDYNTYGGYGVEQSSASGPLTEAHEQSSGPGYPVETNDINKQFNEINQQLGQLNLQYHDQQHEQPQQQQPLNAPGSVPSYDQGYESINPPSLMEPSYADQKPSQMQPTQPQDSNSYEQQQQQHEQFNHYNPYEQQQPGAGNIFTPAPAAISSDPSASGTGYDGGYWGATGGGEPRANKASNARQRDTWHQNVAQEEDEEDEEDDNDADDDEHQHHPHQHQHQHHLRHGHRLSERSSSTPSPAKVPNGDPARHGESFQGLHGGAMATMFDYHQQQHHSSAAHLTRDASVPKPTISMPNSVSNRPGFNDEADNGTGGAGQQQQGHGGNAAAQKGPGPAGKAAVNQSKKPAATKDSKSGAGGAAGGAQGSGWFGGIWNKFSMKPKNQMILPDDKNPKIVWDEVSKRWVNTDETEAEQEAYKPPPKMTDLMPSGPSGAAPPMPPGAQAAPSQETNPMYQPVVNQASGGGGPTMQAPAATPAPVQSNPAAGTPMPSGEATKVPNLQSNMYKMQRNRTLKRSYVDVFNPSGAAPKGPQEQVLAPSVPTLPTAATGFFVPGGAAPGGQQANDAPEGMPQFYNPNQFAGAGYQQ
ncbi:uncharacterized protein LOC118467662 isoform X2 [Anopheles albimanus]|uniref:uncharacterized protein LOC118467662 isoform X2 n=1 Tax=Anopheles albimanus TaxID=7167 RepID=UPI00163E7848|nr:uncharacterized protein LOC118467662 isoform X2 [Anopheles albimanus]